MSWGIRRYFMVFWVFDLKNKRYDIRKVKMEDNWWEGDVFGINWYVFFVVELKKWNCYEIFFFLFLWKNIKILIKYWFRLIKKVILYKM